MKKTAAKIIAVAALTVLLALCGCGSKKSEITGINVPVPDSFSRSADASADMWTAPDYPADGSNISFTSEKGGAAAFAMMNAKLYEAQLEQIVRSNSGMEIDVNILSFERIELDGVEAIKMVIEYSNDILIAKQIEYMALANGDELYVIAYTQMAGAEWFEEFEACSDRITFERK